MHVKVPPAISLRIPIYPNQVYKRRAQDLPHIHFRPSTITPTMTVLEIAFVPVRFPPIRRLR